MFEQLIVKLLGNICERSVMAKSIFIKLNKVDSRDEDLEDMIFLRRDLGKILVALCESSEPSLIF